MKLFLSILAATILLRGPVPYTAPGGAAFSDDFNRADSDSLGANWTEAAGDADINTNTYRLSTGSFGVITSVYTGTACSTANQYAMVTSNASAWQYPWIVFRYTNSGSAYYALQIDGNSGIVEWYKFDNASDTSGTAIGSGIDTGASASGDTWAFTITGTGANTEIRIWRGVTGLPISASNWNGDTTPDGTLTDDPGANAVDSGNYVGIGGQQSAADTIRMENFFGGDIP